MTREHTPRLGPAYRIQTERLLVRCWSPRDALRLRAALDVSDQYLRPWIPWMRHEPRSLQETAHWLRATRARFDLDKDYRYAIFDLQEQTLLGETSLFTRVGANAREIGYWLTPSCAGRGLATEASAAMVRVAFEVDEVDRIEIHCSPANQASAAIPAKLGFTHEATLKRRAEDSEGAIQDSMIWSLFASDYPGSPSARVAVRAFDGIGERIL